MTMTKQNENSSGSCDVVVIGAGASGALLTIQYMQRSGGKGRLALIGGKSQPGRGIAYGTPLSSNLLNVRAANLSAFPGDPDHFVRWLERCLPGSGPNTYAPRHLYGAYLESILRESITGRSTYQFFADVAVEMRHMGAFWEVCLAHHDIIRARSVVLAVGNLLPPNDPIDFSAAASLYRRNPWATEALNGLPPDAPVLLIGTGLTMVDTALSLSEVGHRGPIHAISRHGLLPQAHRLHDPQPLAELPPDFATPAGGLHWLRTQIEKAAREGRDWRAIIDSLRPHTAGIWRQWSVAQRGVFLRHLRHLWDIHRHRMAPHIAEQLNTLIARGTLTLHQGKLVAAKSGDGQAAITWRDAHAGKPRTLKVARIINCSGPSRDYARTDNPLIAGLRDAGWITPDIFGLGLETDANGHLISADGSPTPGLYTLGPLRIAGLWESIAIPEIRSQASDLAGILATKIVNNPAPAFAHHTAAESLRRDSYDRAQSR